MSDIIVQLLLILLPVTAASSVMVKNLINAVIIYGVLSLLTAVVIFQLQAPDVAFSLLLVNAVSVTIFLFAIYKTEGEE
ncbi:MAG: DUF4040 domain-containing protein [Theionarchaea archaeon]|nr:DUF4040 domain-containing protein [Theionarchaea archaeon]MBU7000269.1 DUF4040 domain-containing protein [Theionarchaea archaeon]MBU7022070.1 DUF4040 domain-containing protein [Theionarchaea archaeon]MBU7034752.1 DUF4040 domain-containing protein [Theionarchaea archaeon]MBU7040461.1 DUF4040 domain-containing protein [Theionarchaea archaeon]